MNFIELLEQLKWMPSLSITLIDIIQIIILALALYYLIKSLYKTRAWILMKGLLIIGIVYLIIWLTDMVVLQLILQSAFSALLIAIVIMLQPELQRIVELIGKKKLTNLKALLLKKQEIATWYSEKTAYEIVSACETMSAAKTGALIVIERSIPLEESIQSGIKLSASMSGQLLVNIFEKNTPLHDGAVVIRNNKIESATCYLPLSMDPSINKKLGTRHRAALGISESSDCVVVVVSEETGAISFCVNGHLKHNINRTELSQMLNEYMSRNDEIVVGKKKSKAPMWMKILAPILSVVVWIAVITVSDPVIVKTIDRVPVTTINTEVLDDIGQAYTIQNGNTISVKVQGRRSLVDDMSPSDLIATADFTSMSVLHSVPITITTTKYYDDVAIVADGTYIMKLEIEDLVQTDIPVEVQVVGDTNQNYVIVLKEVESNTLTVTCPQSIAKTLDKAILTVDAYGKEVDFISTASPVIYDKNGAMVEEKQVSLSKEAVRVVMSVYEVKEVPITISLTEQDTQSDVYYIMNGYKAECDVIKIAADDETIKNIQEINITVSPDANNENANSVLVNLQQYMPDNVYLAKNQNDQISVELDLTKYQRKEIALSVDDIKITGYNTANTTATITSAPTSIVLYYNTSVVSPETITLEMLNPTIKITNTEYGKYDGSILVTDIDGVYMTEELVAEYSLTRKR